MNKAFKHRVWALHDFTDDTRVLGEQYREDPEILTRLAQATALFKSIVNPITPTADDPSAFIDSESPKEG